MSDSPKMDAAKEMQMNDAESNNSMDDNSSDNNDETWDEIDTESENHIICLFCPQIFKTMAVALEHCKVEHHFNLVDIKIKFNMDCYSYICMVNYIRKQGVVPDVITSSKEALWLSECYLTPVLQDDPWLMFDFEGLESPSEDESMSIDNQLLINAMESASVHAENGFVTLSEGCFAQLQQALRYWSEQVHKKESMLAEAVDQLTEMKTVAAKIVCNDITAEEKELDVKLKKMKVSDDNEYFRSYSHFGVHHMMLSDKVRTCSYRDAIVMNPSLFADKLVLDVGCGSGILSMFAATANAEKVFGVDQSEIIYHATDIVRENNLLAKIDLIHGKIEQLTLPVEKVDVIISEWLGYFLLFEGMLDSVLYARDKFLKPNGHLLPNRCSLFMTGLSDHEHHQKMVGFWSDVYGYKMSCFAKDALAEAVVTDVPPETVATSSAAILHLDLYTCGINDTNFTSAFTLESRIDGEITALCGYFSVHFDLPYSINFSTSPEDPKTHWMQTVFLLPQPITVRTGMKLDGQITCKRKPEDNRALIVTIQILNQKNDYVLA